MFGCKLIFFSFPLLKKTQARSNSPINTIIMDLTCLTHDGPKYLQILLRSHTYIYILMTKSQIHQTHAHLTCLTHDGPKYLQILLRSHTYIYILMTKSQIHQTHAHQHPLTHAHTHTSSCTHAHTLSLSQTHTHTHTSLRAKKLKKWFAKSHIFKDDLRKLRW